MLLVVGVGVVFAAAAAAAAAGVVVAVVVDDAVACCGGSHLLLPNSGVAGGVVRLLQRLPSRMSTSKHLAVLCRRDYVQR